MKYQHCIIEYIFNNYRLYGKDPSRKIKQHMEQVDTKQENYNSEEDSNAYSRNQNNMPEMKSVFDWSPRLYNVVTENSIRKDFLN